MLKFRNTSVFPNKLYSCMHDVFCLFNIKILYLVVVLIVDVDDNMDPNLVP